MTGYTWTSISAVILFAFVSSITPGPNNLMLLHSGARFGFRKSMAHMWGINIGFGLMLMLCCLGIASVVLQLPQTQLFLKIIGCAYMVWLAYKLWINGALPSNLPSALADSHTNTHTTAANPTQRARPMSFMQAVLFQYVNPKAWMMALSVPATLLPSTGSLWHNATLATSLFMLINALCISVWLQGGVLLQKLMHHPKLAHTVNMLIVAMTLYCAASVWF